MRATDGGARGPWARAICLVALLAAAACVPPGGSGSPGRRPVDDGGANPEDAEDDTASAPDTADEDSSAADSSAADSRDDGTAADLRDGAPADLRDGAPSDLRDAAADVVTNVDGFGPGPDAARTCSGAAGSCLCALGEPEQGTVPVACNATSVVGSADERAACCQSLFSCRCTSYACAESTATGVCSCAAVVLLDSGSRRVASCMADARRKCCLSESLTQCDCIPANCAERDTEVPSCAPASIAVCTTTETRVTACSTP